MKRYLGMLLCVLACARMANAAPDADTEPLQQVVFRVDFVRLTEAGAAHLRDNTRLPNGWLAQAVQSGQGQLVQTSELMAVTRRDAVMLVGQKTPLVYYDPKASQFQIQYVDVGAKLNALARAVSDGVFEVEAKIECSSQEALRAPGGPAVSGYPMTGLFSVNVKLPQVHFGEAFVVMKAGGAEPHRLQAEHFAIILTLVRP